MVQKNPYHANCVALTDSIYQKPNITYLLFRSTGESMR